MVRIISWNMAHRQLWSVLAEASPDLALLQEAVRPPADQVIEVIPDDANPWTTAGWEKREWRTAIARFSDRVALSARPTNAIHDAVEGDWTSSRQGTIAAADVSIDGRLAFTAVSVYAPWERTGSVLYADASAHRILSDLSALIPSRSHRLLIAGDWNILYGYGEHGDAFFGDRYRSVFDRAAALGLRFVGPQYPNGRRAQPWPDELPIESRCVPTFHHSQQSPATATRQLDFVFASASFADHVHVTALNEPAEWGASDHCRLRIDVDL